MKTTPARAEVVAFFAKQEARAQGRSTRKPLREELQYSPEGYLPPIDEHYPELSRPSRAVEIDCQCDEPNVSQRVVDDEFEPDDGLMAGGPWGFWIFVTIAGVAVVSLVLCEFGLIGP